LRRRYLLVMLAALAAFPGQGALADRDRKHGERDREAKDDSEDAARARRAGDIRPLSEILEMVQKAYPGEVVGVEFERKHGNWTYEIKLVSPDNRYLEIYVDARTKEVVKVEGK